MPQHFITKQSVDEMSFITLDFDVLELIEELETDYFDSDFSLVPIYDEQGFFYSYDM